LLNEQPQNSFFKFAFPTFRRMLSKCSRIVNSSLAWSSVGI